ncbi:MAG: hypothetical protein ACJ8GK_08290 [Luteimonas sp.]
MFSAADLIDALRRRGRRTLRPDTPAGEFPPGWAQWFEAIGQRIGRISGATADAIVAVLLQREPAPPPRSAAELNRWQAFATLWRQQWLPPEREERRARATAIAITVFVHLVLLAVLLWLASVRLVPLAAPAGEEVVQVEFIGEGTPRDQGGGPPAGAAPTPAAAIPPAPRSAPPPAATANPSAQPPAPTPPAEVAATSQTPVAEQPLQVSEKPVPEAAFALPPPTPRVVELPQAPRAEPKLQAPVRDIELVQALPQVRALQPRLPETTAAAPQLRNTPQAIEIVRPLPAVKPLEAVAAQPAPTQPATLRQVPSEVPLHEAVSEQPVASGVARPATARSAPSPNPSVEAGASPPSGMPRTPSGTQQANTAAGRGPASTSKPGAWPTPRPGDDWGASTRERPGGQAGSSPGILNADGTPKLGAGTAQAGGGYPPGTDNWTTDQIDRAGTWLKRPSNSYEPTRFDKVWVPNETLLEQWVRQNIRSMDIPIPGTSKKLHCVVSLLQLGGGCGITDPNMQDQEATARPPPDVPFKPDLQEDQGALRKPPAP